MTSRRERERSEGAPLKRAGDGSANRAWWVTIPLALVAVAVVIPAQVGRQVEAYEWLFAVVFFGVFALADATVLRFEMRRQAYALSLVEVPLLLALASLSPVLLVVSRSAAATVMRARRQSPAKLWFNTASIAAGAAVASFIVSRFRPPNATPLIWGDPVSASQQNYWSEPTSWLVLAGALQAAIAVTLVAFLAVITVAEGKWSVPNLTRTAMPAVIVGFVNITFGLVVLLVLNQSRWGIILLIALGAFFVVGYRSYAQFVRQHNTLTEMYDLAAAIRDTTQDGTLSDSLLHRVRALLRAEYATLWLPARGRHPEVLLTARIEESGLLDVVAVPEAVRQRAFDTGETISITPKHGDDGVRAALRATGTKDAIIVPLRSGTAVVGCLEVARRLGGDATFSHSDVRLLEAVAAHVGVAVENSRLVDRLRFDAYHDALTGLANRRRVIAALGESVTVRAPGEVVAVLMFDVDGMREVNESLGHGAGDRLLTEVANRLRTHAPASALVGRVGGDELVVTLRADSADAAVNLATELRAQVRGPMMVETLSLDVDTVVGVVVHPDHGTDAATLLQRADLATKAAKSIAAGVQLFNVGLESRSTRRLSLAGDLRRALENQELDIYFQPKVSLRDRRLVGVECLARWEHAVHGSVAPEDFVAVAEHTGHLELLTDAVLREGLRRCRQWADAGRPLSVAINLAPRTLLDPDFPAHLGSLIDEYAVSPERVTLELAERGVLGEAERPMPTLHRLHDLGVRLSVDDFGTGYSSLAYLRRLPVHEVKIDRTFVGGMATDPGDLAIVRAVVDLARHFGLVVVAEGVESELTLDLLEDMGCDLGQGFLFSRPLPYERLEAWFAAQTEVEPTPAGEVRRLRAVP